MVTKEQIEQVVRDHLGRVLLVAETALPPSQFEAFRKYCLNEFGNNGLGRDLDRLLCNRLLKDRDGTGRNTLSKEGGAP